MVEDYGEEGKWPEEVDVLRDDVGGEPGDVKEVFDVEAGAT